jgi:hypothetical protein
LKRLLAAAVLVSVVGCGEPAPEPKVTAPETSSTAAIGGLTLASPDEALVETFNWAREQALDYVREGDPVGLWYEAALPGREAFCMRDVAHQAVGAQALGLGEHTRNMMAKFADNISEAKDWCTYWEINRQDVPAPVDYRNDKEFWYNLPANFDLVAAGWRLYRWSGDTSYLDDPALVAFYERTLGDYVERWDLAPQDLRDRERFMNRDSFDPEDYYQYCRGIPSYHEGNPGMTRVGVDLLAFQVAAYRGYAGMAEVEGDDAKALEFRQRSEEVRSLITELFWNPEASRFETLLLTDGTLETGGGLEAYLLYNDALESPEEVRAVLQALRSNPGLGIEIRSHHPEVLYRYGASEEAYRTLLELGHPETERREYPEVSFTLVGAIVAGMMGVEPQPDGSLQTLSRLTEETPSVALQSLPVAGVEIDLEHRGRALSTLRNRSGVALKWRATFAGRHAMLSTGDRDVAAASGFDAQGAEISWLDLEVAPGEAVTVAVATSTL